MNAALRRLLSLGLLLGCALVPARAADPLRVFIRGGVKTHGPNQHDHPRFLGEWTKLLGERGLKVDGAMEFPTAAQLAQTDVLVIYAADGMKIEGQQRTDFETFLKRGGGVVVIHDGIVSGQGSDNPDWTKKIVGGAWRWDRPEDKRTKWHEGEVGLYWVDEQHPISRGLSNFDWNDEIYYDLDMAPDAHVLATSFHSVFVIAPQVWTYEKTLEGGTAPYRAVVSLPGHMWDVFETPHYRAILLRSIAWAGRRANADEFVLPEELASLKYPAGGPTPAKKALAELQEHLHPEFTISLAADENVSEKIMSLDWDPRGRLWVVETPEYPGGRDINKADAAAHPYRGQEPDRFPVGGKEDRPPRDRISVLEDTDGDGFFDRRTVWADGLELPTSLVFHRDGVIVAQAPDILWLRDTNGDGKADTREVLYTGWGTFDTHAVINNFRWGPDGWVYGAVGYTRGNVSSPKTGKKFGEINAGLYRFRPDGSALEQVSAGSCNTWGCEVAPDGEIFYTTATCGEPLLHVVMPEKFLARASVGGVRASASIAAENKIYPAIVHTRPPYVQIDWVGAWTAAAGSCWYDGGAWPAKWNNAFFFSEATMHILHNEFIVPDGVTFRGTKEPGREQRHFLASTDLWFRPIHSRVGPDGAMYLVDFYNQVAIHNDTRGPAHGARNAAARPDRDHHFTRVWRIQHKQATPLPAWKLDPADAAGLAASLRHPNGWVRNTAARLLRERGAGPADDALRNLATGDADAPARIAALGTLDTLGLLDGDTLVAAIGGEDRAVRRAALRLAADRDNSSSTPDAQGVAELLRDDDPRVRLNTLLALSTCALNRELADVVLAAWPTLQDKHLQSAALGVAVGKPIDFLEAAFGSADPAAKPDFVGHLARVVATKNDPALAALFVTSLARQPATADALKQAALESLARALPATAKPAWSPGLQSAFSSLLKSPRPGLPGAALPLIARWGGETALADELKPVVAQLARALGDAALPDADRGQVAVNLLGVRQLDAAILPAVSGLLGSEAAPALQRRIIEALGAVNDPAAGRALVAAFAKTPAELHDLAFGTIVKRPDWSGLLVQALADKQLTPRELGPANLHRLRTHADKAVAARANQVIDELKGPEQKEKEALIAQFTHEVEKPGSAPRGRELFTANCAGCHKFNGEGADFAPDLTGMGAHGAHDLLIHILDPNRVVEPNFISASIETKDDLTYDGIILRENNAVVVVRNQTAEYEIRKDNIRTRQSTGRSLMPEGFEALGADGLRDLLTYLAGDDLRFRILNLTEVFNGSSAEGIYANKESRGETVRLRKFGTIRVEGTPFDVISPQKSPTGMNLLTLRGRMGLAPQYPQRVEIPAGIAANRLHFLSGVGGWAYPWDGENQKDKPVLKAIVHFAGGGTEELVFRNGVEFADYIGSGDNFNVPGSKFVPDLVRSGQVRWFARDLKRRDGVIEKVVLESFNNEIAPTIVGITAEKADGPATLLGAAPAPAAAAPAVAPVNWGAGLKTLLIGGGASHDYNRFFNLADVALLNGTGKITAAYREPQDLTAEIVRGADVLLISANKAFPDPAVRSAVMAHAEAGKGLVLLHPGLWYNWPNWPEYNRVLAGGGSRGHDRYGEFEVVTTGAAHPLLKDVPAKFTIADELYWHETDATGTPIEVLATAHSKQKDRAYPQLFVVKHPEARVVGFTLGHDGAAHSHAAYQQILKNAVAWVAGPGAFTGTAQ